MHRNPPWRRRGLIIRQRRARRFCRDHYICQCGHCIFGWSRWERHSRSLVPAPKLVSFENALAHSHALNVALFFAHSFPFLVLLAAPLCLAHWQRHAHAVPAAHTERINVAYV